MLFVYSFFLCEVKSEICIQIELESVQKSIETETKRQQISFVVVFGAVVVFVCIIFFEVCERALSSFIPLVYF